jgi:hypothetical protein
LQHAIYTLGSCISADAAHAIITKLSTAAHKANGDDIGGGLPAKDASNSEVGWAPKAGLGGTTTAAASKGYASSRCRHKSHRIQKGASAHVDAKVTTRSGSMANGASTAAAYWGKGDAIAANERANGVQDITAAAINADDACTGWAHPLVGNSW